MTKKRKNKAHMLHKKAAESMAPNVNHVSSPALGPDTTAVIDMGKAVDDTPRPEVVMQVSTAKPHMDVFDRTLIRYEEYCGVGKHIKRDQMILHQKRLWVSLKQGIVNTSMEEISTFMDHIVKKFHEHKRGVLGEQRLFRYIVNQSNGKTCIDEYAINIYGLLQVACERYDESRPSNMVDLNKAVAEAEPKVAEKVYAYFNTLGTSPLDALKDKEPVEPIE